MRRGAMLLAGVLAAGPALAAPPVKVTGGTLRVLLASRPAAGYFSARNEGSTELSLTGASSPGCGSIMLHRSMSSGGMEMMREVGAVALPAGGTIRFAPGGYHLMCMQPHLVPGTKAPVTLDFAGGLAVTSDFSVVGAR